MSSVGEIDITRGKSAGLDEAAAALSGEQWFSAREIAVQLREKAADLREREIQAAEELQAASDEYVLMLQQANSRLVVATLEAQQLAERLEAAQVQLESAKSLAEKSNLAKSEFLSSMSHELRTPLNAILGFAQLIESGSPPLTPTQNANIAQILQAGWYLLSLVNKILDLAVIESGKLPVSREPVLLIDVIRECLAMVESKAKKHNIHVTLIPFDNSWFVMADPTRVKQVLINLLTNAIKYNREHGTVEVRCAASSAERMRISVRDSGVGLSAEKLTHLFEPFNRLGQEAGTEEGTGIGLVVSKQLIELMGGAIGVQSTVGFWIELMRELGS
ncbi:ATP-binding protein [Rhodoferax sp.]|uniref:sensor histidine kinase n=1 Tax=Rhodoferax sp. TaxID=50421 RepID=UPI00342FF477